MTSTPFQPLHPTNRKTYYPFKNSESDLSLLAEASRTDSNQNKPAQEDSNQNKLAQEDSNQNKPAQEDSNQNKPSTENSPKSSAESVSFRYESQQTSQSKPLVPSTQGPNQTSELPCSGSDENTPAESTKGSHKSSNAGSSQPGRVILTRFQTPLILSQPVSLALRAGFVTWVSPPDHQESSVEYPEGLDHLLLIEKLVIRQNVKLSEGSDFSAFVHKSGKHLILDEEYKLLYVALLESEEVSRTCLFWTHEDYEVIILDNKLREVLRLCRPYEKDSNIMSVESPRGSTIGFVCDETKWHFRNFHYIIKDVRGNILFSLLGPTCFQYRTVLDIEIVTSDNYFSGRIVKRITKMMERNIDHTNVVMTFPFDLDVKLKALLLASVFLIDISIS